ncbi:MAG: hypothetical protein IJT36_07170 [Alphaproteobacteria bacterium]|nr:hypothetical protein [Alphaproteobacteria bacterium]
MINLILIATFCCVNINTFASAPSDSIEKPLPKHYSASMSTRLQTTEPEHSEYKEKLQSLQAEVSGLREQLNARDRLMQRKQKELEYWQGVGFSAMRDLEQQKSEQQKKGKKLNKDKDLEISCEEEESRSDSLSTREELSEDLEGKEEDSAIVRSNRVPSSSTATTSTNSFIEKPGSDQQKEQKKQARRNQLREALGGETLGFPDSFGFSQKSQVKETPAEYTEKKKLERSLEEAKATQNAAAVFEFEKALDMLELDAKLKKLRSKSGTQQKVKSEEEKDRLKTEKEIWFYIRSKRYEGKAKEAMTTSKEVIGMKELEKEINELEKELEELELKEEFEEYFLL